ncbi:DUF748 domain-containing protein [Idiomarina seosinensis]|uniref:DUF748 domain-containing protein n=1 Tax=Idiomarina seosinensis TaxID=281739 RepID=UPI00384E285C
MHSASLNSLGHYLRTKWVSPRRIRFWLVVLVILYTLLGFFGLPWAVQYVAEDTAEKDFDRELSIKSVQANPFTLTLRIDGFELKDTDGQPLLSWERLFVDFAWSSITNQAWTFKTIRLDNPLIHEERFVSGETRLSKIIAESSSPTDAGSSKSAALPAVRINQLLVDNAKLRFTDNLTSSDASDNPEQTSLVLENIRLSVENFLLPEEKFFPLKFNGQLAQGGNLTLEGEARILPSLSLKASTSISDLVLQQAEPYLQQFAKVQIDSGALSVNGQISTNTNQPFQFRGAGRIETLSITEGSEDEALIGWKRLQTDAIELNLADKRLEVDPVQIEGLAGEVIILADKTTNFGKLMVQPRTDAKDEKTNNNKRSGDDQDAPFKIAVERITLSDGTVQFTDNSLPLPFSTRIHKLNGEVSTLSSASAEPARVTLEGDVADYGLATAEGVVNAWHPTRQTKIQLRFRNLKIPDYSPYTVNFAGRKIAGGSMDLDLDYAIDDNQLDGQNNLLLHDLKLGEKMASSDAMDLPLDLAIALLQDSDGVIDLTVPVTGNVGNPQFDLSQVIQQAIGNAISSVVTAPFSFLASLVGAESEDLGKIEFLAGRSDLLPPQRERINKLKEALNQRPQLQLELAGPYNPDFDKPRLKRKKATQALQKKLTAEERQVEEPSLTAEQNQDIIETMFTTYYPDKSLTDLKDYFTKKAPESTDEDELDALSYRNYLAEQIIAAQTVSIAELKAVANDRAEAVRDALANKDAASGVSAQRIEISEPVEAKPGESERIAMEIGIKAG